MTPAQAILTDLLADDSDWWAGELQTVTGHHAAEYRECAKRMTDPQYKLAGSDKRLLYGAALGLIYCDPPYLKAREVKLLFGEDWKMRVEEFMMLMRGKE